MRDHEAVGQWLLYEIPRHAAPTQGNLCVAREEYDAARGFHHDRDRTSVGVAKGLNWLKKRGWVEKWRPPAWRPGRSHPFRLTPAGEAELERREVAAAERREQPEES